MKMLSRRHRKRVLAALIFCVLLAVWFTTRDTGGTVEWLTEPPPTRRSRLGFLGQLKQPVKAHLLRVKYWVLGNPQIVAIQTDVLEIDSPAAISTLISSPAMFSNRTGARAWIVKDAATLRTSFTNPAFTRLTSPIVTTFDGMHAQVSAVERISVGGVFQNVGCFLDLSSHVRGESLRLASFLVVTERILGETNTLAGGNITNVAFTRTNASFGVRVNLPKGTSLFLLASDVTNGHGKSVGALLSPSVWPRK